WHGILARCEKPRQSGNRRYGGRGITVCERWHDINAFLADVGSRPSPQHSLDRVDPDGAYEPTNVRWETASEQSRNWSPSPRAARYVVAKDGREVKLDQVFGVKRQPVWYDGRQAAGPRVLNPHWYEQGAMKAARNARARLVPANVKAEIIARAKQTKRARVVD